MDNIVILQIIIINPLISPSFQPNNFKDYYNPLHPSHSPSFQYSPSFILSIHPTKHTLRDDEIAKAFGQDTTVMCTNCSQTNCP